MKMGNKNRNKIKMIRLLFILSGIILCMQVDAQPSRRRVQSAASAKEENKADMASRQFPADLEMPEDVAWRRDVYRQLDLTLDKNAPLYYPVEPSAGQVNLFTYLFDLLLTGKITGIRVQTRWKRIVHAA